MSLKPAILIGAPRSGTNMLRDLICLASAYQTWPCDEINAVWRHGNIMAPTDAIDPNAITPVNSRYIRGAFEKFSRKAGTDYILEKTCANSLRVPFVDKIFPDAKYIFLTRHGLDAALSAEKRWKSKFDLIYALKKLRYVPLRDLPRYGGQHLLVRARRIMSDQETLSSWGPKFEGMNDLVRNTSVLDVSIHQWKACVTASYKAFQNIDPERVISIRYEDFVRNPAVHLRDIMTHLDQPSDTERIQEVVKIVSASGTGRWKSKISSADKERYAGLINPILKTLSYEPIT